MTATSEAIKEYMVNPISMGIRAIRMKLSMDVFLKASYNLRLFDLQGQYKKRHSVQCYAFGPHDRTCKVLLSGCLMAATLEAVMGYMGMANAISVGIMSIRMKLDEDVDLQTNYKINYF